MSDKMLMEDWRKFLSEDEEQKVQNLEDQSDNLIEQLPKKSAFWNELFALSDYKYAVKMKFDRLEKMDQEKRRRKRGRRVGKSSKSSLFREGWGMSSWNMRKILRRGRPDRTTVEEIIKYYIDKGELKGGSQQKWEQLVFFVLTCYVSNRDEDLREVIGNVAEFFGEGHVGDGARKGVAAIATTAVGALGITGWGAILVAGLGFAPLASAELNDWVTKRDWDQKFQPGLKQAFGADFDIKNHELLRVLKQNYNAQIAAQVQEAVHRVEFEVLTKLIASPDQFPQINDGGLAETFKSELDKFIAEIESKIKDSLPVGPAAGGPIRGSDREEEPEEEEEVADEEEELYAAESKFHDNWRDFLLTEEKLWNS